MMTKYNEVVVIILLLLISVASKTAFANCETAPEPLLELIEKDLVIEGAALVKKTARMVKSGDYQNIHFIAARLRAENDKANGDIGLWASNSLIAGKGMIFSVNSTALAISNWPNGKKSPLRLTKRSKGARKSIACVKKAADS